MSVTLTSQNGFLTVNGETAVGQTGPQGPQGPQGLQGPQGTSVFTTYEVTTSTNIDINFNTCATIYNVSSSTYNALIDSSGNGVNNTVNAIAIDQSNNVYVGGSFASAANTSKPANCIAKWDGTNWSALIDPSGNGVNGAVNAIAIDQSNNVYVGGSFTLAAGTSKPANYIAKWDGSRWSALIDPSGNGVNNAVNAIAIDQSNNVYVGGSFTLAAGTDSATSKPANYIAKWDGTNWSALIDPSGNGVNSTVNAISIDQINDVYVGGNFTLAAGTKPANRLAKWNGTNWSALIDSNGGNGVNDIVRAIAIDQSNNVYVGGSFTTAANTSKPANRIAKWDGTNWSAFIDSNGNGVNNTVTAIAIDQNNNVYVGGVFTSVAGKPANHIAKWNGTNWSNIGNGLSSTIRAISISQTNNGFIGGDFITVNNTLTANSICSLNVDSIADISINNAYATTLISNQYQTMALYSDNNFFNMQNGYI